MFAAADCPVRRLLKKGHTISTNIKVTKTLVWQQKLCCVNFYIVHLPAVPFVAGSAESEDSAACPGAWPLAAGAAADCPVGRLLKEGHTMPTSITLTKYWSGNSVALRLAPLDTASMMAGMGLPLPNLCRTLCASKPAFGQQLHCILG